jgi:hypothetical protein
MDSMTKQVILVAVLATASFAQHDVETIIQRSVDANALDWKAAPDYDYVECDRQPGGGTKTYEELMILGSPYERLVAVNGKPLSPEPQAQEQQKLEATVVERQKESPQGRRQRIAKYEKEREGDDLMMEQLTKALDFKLVGEQRLGAQDVYVLKATPRPGYKPPNAEAKVLTGMEGKLWTTSKHSSGSRSKPQSYTRFQLEVFSPRSSRVHTSNWRRCLWQTASGFPNILQ